jgi:hypothetical protein
MEIPKDKIQQLLREHGDLRARNGIDLNDLSRGVGGKFGL